jgi:2-methylcitrate dehydratase PrpD
MPSYSEHGAEWFTALRYDELPEDVVEATKLRLLDVIGLVLAACPTALGRSAREAALAMGGGTGARLLGFGDRATPMCAALANGTLSQPLGHEDPHDETIIHASSPNVAVALALGEAVGCSGREVLTVIAGAIELTVRIGLAAPGQFRKVGFHPSGVLGTFGAAYAASRILGLEIEGMRNAVGIAGSQASGLLACEEDRTQSKFLHAGWSALSGIAAALLAQAGCTGPARVFESRYGFFASHVQDAAWKPDLQRITAALGDTWECRNMSFKSGSTVDHIEGHDVQARFREHAARMLKPLQVEAIIERVDTLEQARSLQPLVELCVAREP